jgi:hypothetical protein
MTHPLPRPTQDFGGTHPSLAPRGCRGALSLLPLPPVPPWRDRSTSRVRSHGAAAVSRRGKLVILLLREGTHVPSSLISAALVLLEKRNSDLEYGIVTWWEQSNLEGNYYENPCQQSVAIPILAVHTSTSKQCISIASPTCGYIYEPISVQAACGVRVTCDLGLARRDMTW